MDLSRLSRSLIVLFLLSCAPMAMAQDPLVVTYDPNIQQLSVGDIDFGNFGSSNFLFSITVNQPGTMRLKGLIDIQLDDGSTYFGAVDMCTERFQGPITLTNIDIGKNAALTTDQFEFSQQAKDELQNKALATGKLPSGLYRFKLELWEGTPQCNNLVLKYDEKVIELRLQNLSRLDLIYPPDGTTLSTLFPLFQWIYDGRDVEISVYERLSQHASKEEAASSIEHLLVRTNIIDLPPGTNSYQYPTATVRPLEPGRTYVWKVRGLIRGGGGTEIEINSEIWQFTISSEIDGSSSETEIQNIVNQIQFLNGLTPKFLLDLLNGNIRITGVVLVDGVPLSPAEVIALLQDLANNPDRVISIEIVDL